CRLPRRLRCVLPEAPAKVAVAAVFFEVEAGLMVLHRGCQACPGILDTVFGHESRDRLDGRRFVASHALASVHEARAWRVVGEDGMVKHLRSGFRLDLVL